MNGKIKVEKKNNLKFTHKQMNKHLARKNNLRTYEKSFFFFLA